MAQIWIRRLRIIAAGLSAVMAASLGLAGILHAAGDSSGAQALLGAASVCGVVLFVDLIVLVMRSEPDASATEAVARGSDNR
jgi:hypothetical protein